MKPILIFLSLAFLFAFAEEKKITYSQPEIEFIRSQLYFANRSVDSLSGDYQIVKRALQHIDYAYQVLDKNYQEALKKDSSNLNKKPK